MYSSPAFIGKGKESIMSSEYPEIMQTKKMHTGFPGISILEHGYKYMIKLRILKHVYYSVWSKHG